MENETWEAVRTIKLLSLTKGMIFIFQKSRENPKNKNNLKQKNYASKILKQ